MIEKGFQRANYNILLGNKLGEVIKMSVQPTQNFQGIVSCLGQFSETGCVTKTIEFSLSSILLITALGLLYQYIRMFGFKDKIYINLAMICMVGFLISNMVFSFWNSLYPLYSIQTYCHNLYFLFIVVYTTKSYLLKQPAKQKLNDSRVSTMSNDSNEDQNTSVMTFIRSRILTNVKFYKLLYKTMTLVFLLLFTLIFITSLIGDIKSNEQGQTLTEDQGQQPDYTLFSFLKDSCEELWYLCVNGICILLSMIILIVLYKNYHFEQERIKTLTLVTTTIHEKPAPFVARDSRNLSHIKMMRTHSEHKKMNNPLGKLALWVGVNILGQIVDLVESGLLLNADPQQQCHIIPSNPNNNSILMLFFVILSVYIQYSISLWFFFDMMRRKLKKNSKSELLIEAHEYSEEIRVGQIELNPSLRTSNLTQQ